MLKFKIGIVFFVITFFESIYCYCPVVCFAGLLDFSSALKDTCDEIAKQHPGTKTYLIQPGLKSVLPIWKQADIYSKDLHKIFNDHPDCVNIVGNSLGNLIVRAILARTPNHPVKTYIHSNGLLNGAFNFQLLNWFLPFSMEISKEFLHLIAYNSIAQNHLSVANAFNDPQHQEMFLKENIFLPVLNNLVDHPEREAFKKSFLRLKKLVLLAGTADEIVNPWESNAGGYFDSQFNRLDFTHQTMYINDTFGFRTLHERGDVVINIAKGVGHAAFVSKRKNVRKYIIPYLD